VKPLADCHLYTFIDSAYLLGRQPSAVAEQLCRGGSDIIQLRAKDWSREQIAEAAEQVLPVARRFGVPLVINDHIEVARELGAEFCHLGQEDFFDAGHQRISELPGAGRQPAIGLSTHAPEQAQRAVAAGPAYVAIGPIYATGTKPSAKPVTLEYVRWASRNVEIPWFAIGGITLANLPDIIAAGAKRICVVSAILRERDIAAACRNFRSALERNR
jgi:thiamine-phosphate pyrophosphorylase